MEDDNVPTNDLATALGDALAGNATSEPDPDTEAENLDDSAESEDLDDETDEESGSDDDGTEEDDDIEAPESLTAAEKEEFAKLPKEAKEILVKRHNDMEKHFHKTRQREAESARLGDSVRETLEPFKQLFAQNGLDESAAVRYLAGQYGALMKNPKAAIANLAQHFNIDFAQSDDEYEDDDPKYKKLEDEIGSLKAFIQRSQQDNQATRHAEATSQVNTFAAEKDENGKPLHPHFDKVRQSMARLMHAGEAADMYDAYEKAVNLRPELTKKDREHAAARKRKTVVTKAKHAAVGIQGETGTAPKATTWEESISAALRQQKAS